jgi:DNA-binding response OmpR family regulator
VVWCWLCEDSLKTRYDAARAARYEDGSFTRPRPSGADLGYRALVVDDEAAPADVVASYLQRDHFKVTVCHGEAEALAVAREVDPDVVVLDLGLPRIDGLEVCRQLRTFSDAFVVMLTAHDTEIDTIVGLSVGADDYLAKPFSPGRCRSRWRAVRYSSTRTRSR